MKNAFKIAQKFAFTLAEVLITLAIIGIVAAITIPSVIANNQKQEFVTGLQKCYNTINNAIALSQAENGPLDTWPWETTNTPAGKNTFFQTYLTPHLKILKDCNTTINQDCWTGNAGKFLGGEGGWVDFNLRSDSYKFQLTDGSSWAIMTFSACVSAISHCSFVYLDVNGKKGPNIVGRDLFQVRFYPITNHIDFAGNLVSTFDSQTSFWIPAQESSIMNSCNPAVAISSGDTCGTRIQREGWKMNY